MRTGGALVMVAIASLVVGCSASGQSSDATPTATATETAQAAGSETKYIEWRNRLDVPITFAVSETDSYDWEGSSRPDHAYPDGVNGYTLPPGQTFKEATSLNTNANSWGFNVTMTAPNGGLDFSDGGSTRRMYIGYDVKLGRQWGMRGAKDFTYTDGSGTKKNGVVEVGQRGEMIFTQVS